MVASLTPTRHLDTFTRDTLPPLDQWPELIFTIPEVRYPPVLNCAHELLDRTCERVGTDRPCLMADDGSVWTYGETLKRASQVARYLVEDLGVLPGNRVLLRGPNNPWLAVCWLGTLKAGAVAVTTMPLLRSAELKPIIEMAGVRLALCDGRVVEDLESAAPPGLRIVGYGGDADELARSASRDGEFRSFETAADDVCMLAFTSGTTGQPKATMHFHRDVLAIADTFSRHLVKPRPDDVFTGSPPLGFTFGLGGLLVFPLRAGASTLLLERAGPDRLLDAVARHRASVVFTAPTAYRAMVPMAGQYDLAALRRCVSAGEALPRANWTAFRDATGIEIIDGIGSTEMLHIFVSAADDEIRPGATGRAVPGFEAAVLDDSGTAVPDGEIGRLAVKGPTGCRYLRGDRQRTYVRDGWNLTGDTYIRDADGYLWYQARSDDMIISAGYNIAGPEVENALLRHPDVLEAAVVASPNEERGHVVKAFVVLREGVPQTEATVKALQDFVKNDIAPYKYPRAIEILGALPRTSTGKVQRFRLREQERARAPGEGAAT
jgi:2-aminobenzoate-CoA ligase